MASKVATPVYYRLLIHRGANLQLSGVYYDTDDIPIDLTGCKCYFALATSQQALVDYFRDNDDSNVLLIASTEDGTGRVELGGAEGSYAVNIPWEDTLTLEANDSAQWWLVLVYADGMRELLFYGPCEVI